jgi:hypothetical protein
MAIYPIHMSIKLIARTAYASALALSAACSMAQSGGNGADNLDWAEEPVPAPPAFSAGRMIQLEMPRYISVKVGVDPDTIVVGGDGVVRYVIAMVSTSGSTSAVYEGIRCITSEVKTYARFNSDGVWTMLKEPAWKALNESNPSQHAKAFARQGGCQGRLATSKQEILTGLKNSPIYYQSQKPN